MKIPLHTIILFVGPSNSGKDYFIDNVLQPGLRSCENGFRFNIQVISSDAIRRDIMNDPAADKMDDRMLMVSEQAFHLLYTRVRSVTTYPVNAHFVIVNTTGLSKDFRNEILKIADDNHYNVIAVVFDYKRDEYFRFAKDNFHKSVIKGHLSRFREELADITHKKYLDVFRVKSYKQMDEMCGNLPARISDHLDAVPGSTPASAIMSMIGPVKYDIEVPDLERYKEHMLDNNKSYYVIGDIHACLEEFKELLEKINWRDEGVKTILVGDLIDKGPFNNEIIKFIHENMDRFIIVRGNHENYVYKRLKNEIENQNGSEFEQDNFSSLEDFTEETKVLFYEIVDKSKAFYLHRDFVVTHVPCKRKYIGKLSPKAERKMMRLTYPKYQADMTDDDMAEALEKFLDYIPLEAQNSQPFHMFGHIPFPSLMRLRNKLGIDTGCVNGALLTAVRARPHGKLDIEKVRAKQEYRQTHLVEIFQGEKLKMDELTPNERARIEISARHKLNFISGTLAPADKDGDVLESLGKALEHYRLAGLKKVVLQPKYMGSRAQVYLERDNET